jgi:hypothetical protein
VLAGGPCQFRGRSGKRGGDLDTLVRGTRILFGVQMLRSLSSQTNSTGNRLTAARFIASWNSPSAMAPSPKKHTVTVHSFVIDGATVKNNPSLIKQWLTKRCFDRPFIFIERFVPRPGMNTTPEMTELERLLAMNLKDSKLIRNTGVRQVIVQKLLDMLGLWKFDVATNHDDLRSAARIALYGMAKDDRLNKVLAEVVRASLDSTPWTVEVKPGERYAP